MLFYKKMMLALASCVIVASCSNSDESMRPAEDKGCVSFTASMKSLSRATETEFEEGDHRRRFPALYSGKRTEAR